MSRRPTLAFAFVVLIAGAGSAGAQRASLAAGAAAPVGDFASSAGPGLDVQLQARTEPIFGSMALRIDITYDRLAGKEAISSYTVSSQSISLLWDFSPRFYGAVGPGYYQLSSHTSINGKNGTSERDHPGFQAALGMNIPVFRWEGFLEVGAVKVLGSGPSAMWAPLRFGVRL